MAHFLVFMCTYHSCQGKVQFEEEKVMKNMKNLNRELTMEELEGVIGGVEPELDLADASEESTIDKLKGLTLGDLPN